MNYKFSTKEEAIKIRDEKYPESIIVGCKVGKEPIFYIILEEVRQGDPIFEKILEISPKSSWPAGEWHNEPDSLSWTDPATGYPCIMQRNMDQGHWLGYVGIPEDHHYLDNDIDIPVHGGITHTGKAPGGRYKGEYEKGLIWIGFDCAHGWDLLPVDSKHIFSFVNIPNHEITYKSLEYIKNECTNLAKALKEVADNAHL